MLELEEIERLKQMLYLAATDIKKLDGSDINDYLHDLSARDYFEEIENEEVNDGKANE